MYTFASDLFCSTRDLKYAYYFETLFYFILVEFKTMAELFVFTTQDGLLYGSVPSTYLIIDDSGYPIRKVGNFIVSYLKAGEVLLGIKYTKMDCFEASKLLLLFKSYLESFITKLTANSIRNNYYDLFLGFNLIDLYEYENKRTAQTINKTKQVYLDCVEKYNVMVQDGKYVGTIYGSVRASGSVKNIKIKMKVKNKDTIKTKYRIEEQKNENEFMLCVDSINGCEIIMKYTTACQGIILDLKRETNQYLLKCYEKRNLDLIEVKIPVKKSLKAGEFKVSTGKAIYDASIESVVWTITNKKIQEEKIKIPENAMIPERNVQIKFKITGKVQPVAHILNLISDTEKMQCWTKNITESGVYEINYK